MKKCFVLSILVFCTATFFAQGNVRKLTVDDAVILAADNNISLKRQKLTLDSLEKKNNYSWNSISPSANISGSMSIPFEEGAVSYSVSASVSLNFTPSLFTSIKAAKLNYEKGIVSYETAVRTVEVNVRKVFYSLLYTKENIALQNRNMETSKARYESNLAKFNKGQLSELDLLSSQYSYDSLLPNLESSKIAYENNMATFKQTLGLSQDVQIELIGNLEDFMNIKEITVDMVVDELPSVKAIQANIEAAENQLLATRFSAWGPSISASYSYGKSGSFGSSTLRGSNGLSLNLRIPLDGYLPWSNGALSIDNQKTTIEDLKLQLESQKETASLEINNSIKRIKQAQLQLNLMKNNVELAQKTYEMTTNAYNHGSKDLLSLQNSADSLMSARISLQSQIYNVISAILDLENTLGVPFGTLGME